MVTRELTALAFFAMFATGCATGPTMRPATQPGPEAAIPVFAASDSRVDTPGFVGQTLRLSKDQDGVKHTLMAFVVGDTLTLGAMVKGPFTGNVHWQLGDRSLAFAFDTNAIAAKTTAMIDHDPSNTLPGQGASFRGIAWINVQVPLAQWIDNGSSVQLTFTTDDGKLLTLPEAGYHYVTQLTTR